MKKKKEKWNINIKCEVCGYQNHKHYVDVFGRCHLCGNILDQKAFFMSQMNKRLHIWKGKKENLNRF